MSRLVVQLCVILLCPNIGTREQSPELSFTLPLLRKLQSNKVASLSPDLLTGLPKCAWLLFTGHGFSSITSFVSLLWMLSSTLTSLFLYCGAKNCTQYSRLGCTNPNYSRGITSLNSWVCCLLHPEHISQVTGSCSFCWLQSIWEMHRNLENALSIFDNTWAEVLWCAFLFMYNL